MKDQGYTYNKYIYTNQETRWATTDEIRASGTYVDLNAKSYPVAGVAVKVQVWPYV